MILILPLSYLPWEETDALATQYVGGGAVHEGMCCKMTAAAIFPSVGRCGSSHERCSSSLQENQAFNLEVQSLSTCRLLNRSAK